LTCKRANFGWNLAPAAHILKGEELKGSGQFEFNPLCHDPKFKLTHSN
jgi:hypothetical protein